MEDLDIHYVHVDSKNRDTSLYPYGNSYTLHFVTPIKGAVKVDLVSAKVPNSMYNLTHGTNVFSTSISSNISLVPGFYSACTLTTEMINRFIDSDEESVYYSSVEGKMYYLSSNSSATITIYSSELAKMFGLAKDQTYPVSLLQTPIGNFNYGIKSENVIDFSLNEYVFLDIEELRTTFFNDLKSSKNDSVNAGNMFAVIPMDVQSTQIKTFKETTDYIMSQNLPAQYSTLSRLTVHWYDKNLNHLNFQGFDNNGFVLRVYTHRVKTAPTKEAEKQRTVADRYVSQVKTRLAEQEAAAKAAKEKEKNRLRFGKWAVFAGILGILVFWYISKKFV